MTTTVRVAVGGLDRIEIQLGRDRRTLTHSEARRLSRLIVDTIGADDAEPRTLAVRKAPTAGRTEATTEEAAEFIETIRARVRDIDNDAERRAQRNAEAHELHHRHGWNFAEIGRVFGISGTTVAAGIDRHAATLPDEASTP